MQVTTIMVPWYCFLIRNCKKKEFSIKCVITNQSKCASGQRAPHFYWNIAWKGILSNVSLLITNQTPKQKPQFPCEKIRKMLQINFMMCNIWKLFPVKFGVVCPLAAYGYFSLFLLYSCAWCLIGKRIYILASLLRWALKNCTKLSFEINHVAVEQQV